MIMSIYQFIFARYLIYHSIYYHATANTSKHFSLFIGLLWLSIQPWIYWSTSSFQSLPVVLSMSYFLTHTFIHAWVHVPYTHTHTYIYIYIYITLSLLIFIYWSIHLKILVSVEMISCLQQVEDEHKDKERNHNSVCRSMISCVWEMEKLLICSIDTSVIILSSQRMERWKIMWAIMMKEQESRAS